MGDMKNRTKNLRLAVSVCAVLAAALFARGAEGGTTNPCVRLMSYNILHGKGADGKVDMERIAGAIRREHPDFVGLQEVDCGVSRSKRIDEPAVLGRLCGLHPTFARAFPYKGGEYGRAMLSREKPIRVESVQLDGTHPGVLLLCEFKDFWFGTMHLDLKAVKQLEQVKIVRNAVLERAKAKPVFLSGDWNATPKSRTLAEMRTFMTVLSCEDQQTFHGFKNEARLANYCIDYIAVDSAHAPAVRVKETYARQERVASDHNPVVAEVEIDISRPTSARRP